MLHMATVKVWSEILHRKPLSREVVGRHITGLLLDGLRHRGGKTIGKKKKKMSAEKTMRLHQAKPSSLPSGAGGRDCAVVLAGCSRQPTDNYQGYVEGKFVYVASPQGGRLTRLSVTRGETIAASHPLFILDQEPEAAGRSARPSSCCGLPSPARRPADRQTSAGNRRNARPVDAGAGRRSRKSTDILKSYEEQYAAGGIALTDLINARAAVETNAAMVRQFESDLAVAALPGRDEQIQGPGRQVAADRAALAQAQWKLQQKQIASPREAWSSTRSIAKASGWRPAIPWSSFFRRRTSKSASSSPKPLVGKLEVRPEHQRALRRLRG